MRGMPFEWRWTNGIHSNSTHLHRVHPISQGARIDPVLPPMETVFSCYSNLCMQQVMAKVCDLMQDS